MLSKEYNEFCLSGYGYLEDIRKGEKYMIVRIKMRTIGQSDEIILDCIVDNLILLSLLNPMYQAHTQAHSVLLRFSCVYSSVGSCYLGMTIEDPAHMLTLHAKLISVGEWYCDGRRADSIEYPEPEYSELVDLEL